MPCFCLCLIFSVVDVISKLYFDSLARAYRDLSGSKELLGLCQALDAEGFRLSSLFSMDFGEWLLVTGPLVRDVAKDIGLTRGRVALFMECIKKSVDRTCKGEIIADRSFFDMYGY